MPSLWTHVVTKSCILTALFLTFAMAAVAATSEAAVTTGAHLRTVAIAASVPDSTPDNVQQWWGLSSTNDGTGTLANRNRGNDRDLYHAGQTFGVDLDWKVGPTLWRVQARDGGTQLTRGEPVALRVWGGGWLKYGHQTWGVDLQLSDTPSYEWYVLGGPSGAPLANGSYFALWSSTANGYLVNRHQTFGVDLDWSRAPRPPASQQISVAKQGTGASTVFVVSGAGFTPNGRVVIRVTTPQLQQVQFAETAGFDGRFVSSHSVPCVSGGQLTVTAFEDRDPTHTFANAVVTTCP
jgi:hypothetical protein